MFPAILNTVAEMDIIIPPGCVLCIWLDIGHIRNMSKAEEKRTPRCLWCRGGKF